MVRHVGVVGGNRKDGVLEPRFLLGALEELAECVVGIADDLMDGQLLFLIYLFIRIGHTEGVMAGECEDSGHEGLFHLGEFEVHVLQEGLVADAPPAIEGLVAYRPLVGIKVLTTIVFLEFGGTGEGHESHRASLSAMEEGRLIAFPIQAIGDARDGVVGVGRQEEGFYKHGDRRENRGHAVDTLTTIAVAMGIGERVGDERVGKGCVALVAATVEVFVVSTDIFTPETLDDNHHDVFLSG